MFRWRQLVEAGGGVTFYFGQLTETVCLVKALGICARCAQLEIDLSLFMSEIGNYWARCSWLAQGEWWASRAVVAGRAVAALRV